MGFLLYMGPSLFRWVRQKTPIMIDPNIGCVAILIDPFVRESYNFDAGIIRTYESEENEFLPYIGNGKVGVAITNGNNPLYLFHKRSLSLPINYDPVVHVEIPGTSSQEGTAVHYTTGIVHKFQCFSKRRKSISISHQFFSSRTDPSLLVQQIEIINPLSEMVYVNLKEKNSGLGGQNVHLSVQNGIKIKVFSGEAKTDTPDTIIFSIAANEVPASVAVDPKSSKRLTFRTVVHYSESGPSSQLASTFKKLESLVQQDIQKAMEADQRYLRQKHIDIWKKLWHSGFGISYSRAQGALNGDKINATLYYVLSNSRDYISEFGTSSQLRHNLQRYLYVPDKCYGGHHTLQASTLWSDMKTLDDVNKVVSLWFLTLNKQGCDHLLQAGAEGVMQAMILSFGGFKFSNHHLEFDTEPKDLHRDYYFRRIIYGNATHVNISVRVQEDNKAVLYCALDRSDKDYYACDGGCLDMPLKLGSEPVQLPVKLTNPITAILYITADKQHMEELKHTIHVKEVAEAPALEHHIIALHRHGHQLGGLPALFWVSIAFLIVVFHLFLAKLIYNEYCGSQDKSRGRYVV